MNRVKCPNCGAIIYENEEKCPFCGYINVIGAEEKFMRNMKKTEADLNQIPELQKAEYKSSMKKNSRIVGITMGIVVLVVALFLGLYQLWDYMLFSYGEKDAKEELQWKHETFPVLDEMYEAKDYDGIVAFEEELYQKDSGFDIFDWEHYYFILVYSRYKDTQEAISCLDQGQELTEYTAANLVYDCMWFHYREYSKYSYMLYTEDEIEQIEQWREEMEAYFYDRLLFTDQEIEALYEKAKEKDGLLDYKKCREYGEKIRERFQ